jgi:hypothetical protein
MVLGRPVSPVSGKLSAGHRGAAHHGFTVVSIPGVSAAGEPTPCGVLPAPGQTEVPTPAL